MPEKKMPKPTESELLVLQVLWSRGPSTVREVHEELSKQREVGYTTTLKTMQIMLDKGLVLRAEQGRSHVYRAAVEEGAVQQRLLNQFVAAAFRGSAAKLVLQALGQHQASPEELRAIKDLISEIERRQEEE